MNNHISRPVQVLVAVLFVVLGWVGFRFATAEAAVIDHRSCGENGEACYNVANETGEWARWYEQHGGDALLFKEIFASDFVSKVGPKGESYCLLLEKEFGRQQRLHWLNNKNSGNADAVRFHGSNLWGLQTRGHELGCAFAEGRLTWDSVVGFGIPHKAGAPMNRSYLSEF